ncbi:MAG: TPM domain-containing protein, partial [Desulfuromonas sp.]|nr:TPM domain-containing protein [Desulfuromonas sp.]
MMRLRLATFLSAVLLLTAGSALAAPAIPKARGYVNDTAGLLSPGARGEIENFLAGFERSDSTQIAVLTVPSLEGEDLEGYSVRVAQAWGIGQKGKDNGALLLVAKEERAVRIEVGYGLEDRLTDLLAGRIVDQEIVPRFKAGDFDGGIKAGVQAMVDATRGAYTGDPSTRKKKQRFPYEALLWLLFLGPGVLRMFAGGSRRGGRGGGFYMG